MCQMSVSSSPDPYTHIKHWVVGNREAGRTFLCSSCSCKMIVSFAHSVGLC